MSELDETPRSYSGALMAALAVALVAGIGGLIWSYTLGSRLSSQETALTEAKDQNKKLASDLRETDARLKVALRSWATLWADAEAVGHPRPGDHPSRGCPGGQCPSAGERAERDRAGSNRAYHGCLRREDRRGWSEDGSGQDADRPSHRDQPVDLDEGDLSGHSSLIARNHDELEVLKHKGDRSYYEFTLTKGQKKAVARSAWS